MQKFEISSSFSIESDGKAGNKLNWFYEFWEKVSYIALTYFYCK